MDIYIYINKYIYIYNNIDIEIDARIYIWGKAKHTMRSQPS